MVLSPLQNCLAHRDFHFEMLLILVKGDEMSGGWPDTQTGNIFLLEKRHSLGPGVTSTGAR